MKEKIDEILKKLSAYEQALSYKKAGMFGDDDDEPAKKGEPKLEGIGFRYKTVQYHIIDDSFEEIKKHPEIFGDVKILAESFSLPGWGEETEDLKREEYQFRITCLIRSKTDKENYLRQIEEAFGAISEKHDVDVLVEPTEKYYNINYITFHTSKEGIFSKE